MQIQHGCDLKDHRNDGDNLLGIDGQAEKLVTVILDQRDQGADTQCRHKPHGADELAVLYNRADGQECGQ